MQDNQARGMHGGLDPERKTQGGMTAVLKHTVTRDRIIAVEFRCLIDDSFFSSSNEIASLDWAIPSNREDLAIEANRCLARCRSSFCFFSSSAILLNKFR